MRVASIETSAVMASASWRRRYLQALEPAAGGMEIVAACMPLWSRQTCLSAFLLSSPLAAEELFEPPSTPEQVWAIKTDAAVRIDGDLSEPAWQAAPVITDLIQKEPRQQAPASYPTEVRIVYDSEALYIGVTCYQPHAATRVQSLQRDFTFDNSDVFGVAIDGFLDKRNAVVFQVTPYGSQGDLELINGSEELNLDWDARWHVRTKIDETSWTAELAIPWRILRYPAHADRLGILFARNIRSLNEQASLPAVPRALSIYRMSFEAELRGIEPPSPDVNIQVNPYALNRWTSSDERADGQSDAEAGADIKWAITPSTVLDLTANTDFAQADVDRFVTNLDRFSVFLPERRQFFLESASIFNASVTEWISPFFSRRIGLDESGRPIPLDGGLRLTSRSPEQQVGVLALRQQSLDSEEIPGTDFAVARYSRNIAGQSRLGGMLTYRRDDSLELASPRVDANKNLTYTLDGLWRASQSFLVQGMVSASEDDRTGSGLAGQLWALYQDNNVNVSLLEYYNKDYNPGIGLELLDTNYVMHSLTASYDFRSQRLPRSVRSLSPAVSGFRFESSDDGSLLFAYAPIRPARVRFQNGALIDFHVEPNWQQLDEPFFPAGIEIAPGSYDYTRYRLFGRTDQSAKIAGSVTIETGDYYDGELNTFAGSARVAPWPHLELTADVEVNELRNMGVARKSTRAELYGVNARVALNPRLQLSAFYQRDLAGETDAWNVRFSWEYKPLSFLYLVYNRNEQDALGPMDRLVENQLIAKVTYLFDM